MALDKKCWDYRKGAPWFPVKLIGKARIIEEWAFVDTGAGYCVLHPKFISVLGLKKIKERSLSGFGSKEPIVADIVIVTIEVNVFKEKVKVACIRDKYYPLKVPKVIIGRNFLNKYQISLNGREICIESRR